MQSSSKKDTASSASKRKQVSVACDPCRQRKVKCDGERPACLPCQVQQRECNYAYEPDETPYTALKRKYDALEAESAEDRSLIAILRSASDGEALEVLARLRTAGTTNGETGPARSFASTTASAAPVGRPVPVPRPVQGAREVQEARKPTHQPFVERHVPNLEATRMLPIDPFTQDLQLSSLTPFTRATGSSSLKVSSTAGHLTLDSTKGPAPETILSHIKASPLVWGIDFLTEQEFKDVLTAYFAWDHPSWMSFDADEFYRALNGELSDLSSPLLVYAVVAYALKIYVYFDAAVASKHERAWRECLRLWQAYSEINDENIATACAGALICTIHGSNGADSLGQQVLGVSQDILLHAGLYDPRKVQDVYGDLSSRKARSRAVVAWGMLVYTTDVQLSVQNEMLKLTTPPVPVPWLRDRHERDFWAPWPRTASTVPAFTNDLFHARAMLNEVVRDLSAHQRLHQDAALNEAYFKATSALHARFLQWKTSLPPDLRSDEKQSQHVFTLFAWYHFCIVQLFRPFATDNAVSDDDVEGNVEAKTWMEVARRETSLAITRLQRLLVHREALYGDLGTHVLLSQPALAVAFDAMPKSSPESVDYSPSAHMAFLSAIRILVGLSRSMPVISAALLGIQQAASRSGFALPSESRFYLERAKEAVAKAASEDGAGERTANWVVDLPRSTGDIESARLQSLLAEFEMQSI